MKLFSFARVLTTETQINPPIFWKNTRELSWFLKTIEGAYFSCQILENNENHALQNAEYKHITQHQLKQEQLKISGMEFW